MSWGLSVCEYRTRHPTVHALNVSLNVSRLCDGHKASASGRLTKTSYSWGPRRPEVCNDGSPTLHTWSPTTPNKHFHSRVTKSLAKPVMHRPFPPSVDCPATAKIQKGEAARLYNSHGMQSPLATRQGPRTLQQGVLRPGPGTRQPRGKAGQLRTDTASPEPRLSTRPRPATGSRNRWPTAPFSQHRPPHCAAPRALTNSGAKRRCYATPPPAESLTQLHSHQQ